MKFVSALVLIVALAATLVAAQQKAPVFAPIPAPANVAKPPAASAKTASGLASIVLQPGTGKTRPGPADLATVNYTGWTTDGKMFDSSVARATPAVFALNEDLIRGWTEGVPFMVEGERTRFWIPESLAYGGSGDGPRGMLVFDLELISIQ